MKYSLFLFFALLALLSQGEVAAQDIEFSKETFANDVITLPYRKATIPGYGDKASLIIYLHEGSSKDNDNETQIQEPGINSITSWLSANNRKAIMLVPQCPTDKAWLGSTQDVLVALLKTYIDRGVADADKVYIFGGSMGELAHGVCSPITQTYLPPPCLSQAILLAWMPRQFHEFQFTR